MWYHLAATSGAGGMRLYFNQGAAFRQGGAQPGQGQRQLLGQGSDPALGRGGDVLNPLRSNPGSGDGAAQLLGAHQLLDPLQRTQQALEQPFQGQPL